MKHPNDTYGDVTGKRAGGSDAIPAVTVILLRDAPEIEVLMLHKTSTVAFGGMWAFPGGRVDEPSRPTDSPAWILRSVWHLVVPHRGQVWRRAMRSAGLAGHPVELR